MVSKTESFESAGIMSYSKNPCWICKFFVFDSKRVFPFDFVRLDCFTVYQWAEVLDADVFAAFRETGNVFDPETAERVRKYVYSAGNTEAPDELFRKFRGRDPDIQYMLEKKCLV